MEIDDRIWLEPDKSTWGWSALSNVFNLTGRGDLGAAAGLMAGRSAEDQIKGYGRLSDDVYTTGQMPTDRPLSDTEKALVIRAQLARRIDEYQREALATKQYQAALIHYRQAADVLGVEEANKMYPGLKQLGVDMSNPSPASRAGARLRGQERADEQLGISREHLGLAGERLYNTEKGRGIDDARAQEQLEISKKNLKLAEERAAAAKVVAEKREEQAEKRERRQTVQDAAHAVNQQYKIGIDRKRKALEGGMDSFGVDTKTVAADLEKDLKKQRVSFTRLLIQKGFSRQEAEAEAEARFGAQSMGTTESPELGGRRYPSINLQPPR